MKVTAKNFLYGTLYALAANLICLGLFQMIVSTDILPLDWIFWLALYISVIPIYLIFFRHRSASFAYGTLIAQVLITLIVFILGNLFFKAISDAMVWETGSNFDLLAYLLFDFIPRTVIGFIAPAVHLIICGMRKSIAELQID